MQAIIGEKELENLLKMMSSTAGNALCKPAISAGLKVAAKGIKRAVPAQFKDAKKAIGWRNNKSKRTGEATGKVGAAVGMKAKQIKKTVGAQFLGRVGRPGVGISARNIMWWIMGTAMRFTGSKRARSKFAKAQGITRISTGKTVHATGRMPAQMDPVKEGVTRSMGEITNAISVAATKALRSLVLKVVA